MQIRSVIPIVLALADGDALTVLRTVSRSVGKKMNHTPMRTFELIRSDMHFRYIDPMENVRCSGSMVDSKPSGPLHFLQKSAIGAFSAMQLGHNCMSSHASLSLSIDVVIFVDLFFCKFFSEKIPCYSILLYWRVNAFYLSYSLDSICGMRYNDMDDISER